MSAVTDPAICQLDASDGYSLRYRRWRPAGAPLGYVVALHGIQSHSGWYGYSSGRLADAGFDVSFLDRRGSGLNEADRGHVSHYERLVSDVSQLLARARSERNRAAPAAPVVLIGVSWGGKLAAVTCALRPDSADGLALLYPGIRARVRPRWHQKQLLRLAAAAGDLRRTAPIPLDDPALFTSVPEWRRFIAEDPLALRRATVSFFRASVELDRLAGTAGDSITCPTLVMLAGRDRIIDNAATREWFGSLRSPIKALFEYRDAAHTLEFEPDRERFVDDLIGWIGHVPRLGTRAPGP